MAAYCHFDEASVLPNRITTVMTVVLTVDAEVI